jgi:hypothetical protein
MSSPPTQQPRQEQLDGDIELAEATLEPAITAPPRQRRRPALIGLGVALVALGGLGAAWLATSVSNTVEVIALRTNVARGDVIAADDLTTASINADPNLAPVPVAQASDIIGQYANKDLVRGSLLTEDSVTTTIRPSGGDAMVGVAVTAGQLPSEPLRSGDTVLIVDTPGSQDDPPTGIPNSTKATVVNSSVDADSGQRTVDVVLPEREAAGLAARVATGRIIIVLLSRGGDAN